MFSRIKSAIVYGIDAIEISVEIDASNGIPVFNIIGLAEGATKESKDRVKSALSNSNIKLPPKKITVSLAPADIKKHSSGLDLAIAVGLAHVSGIPLKIKNCILFSELSLDGKLTYTKGVFPIGTYAAKNGLKFIVSKQNSKEAIFSKAKTYSFEYLIEVLDFLAGKIEKISDNESASLNYTNSDFQPLDISDIKGQFKAKRAIEIAASGFHNILLIGPPGTGKSMIAKRIPSILPPMSESEIIETTKIYSSIGLLSDEIPIITSRPFRSPHHTSSDVSLVGGGSDALPGEVTLSTNGILFLDEFPEFKRNVIEALRQPMEDGYITVSRSKIKVTYPARFLLVAAMNPCLCGYYTSKKRACICTIPQMQKYLSKISGPILDRIDIYTNVSEVDYKDLTDEKISDTSQIIKNRVLTAFEIQKKRFMQENIKFNSQMNNKHIKKFCKLDNESHKILELAMDKMGLSPRSHMKILKVARTIADLSNSDDVKKEHIKEAIGYKTQFFLDIR